MNDCSASPYLIAEDKTKVNQCNVDCDLVGLHRAQIVCIWAWCWSECSSCLLLTQFFFSVLAESNTCWRCQSETGERTHPRLTLTEQHKAFIHKSARSLA